MRKLNHSRKAPLTGSLCALYALLLFASPCWAQTFVQAKSASASAATAVIVTITTTANNFLVIFTSEHVNATSTVAITDSSGGTNVWTQTASGYTSQGAGHRGAMFSSPTTAGVTTVTATWSGGLSTIVQAVVFEVSGMATSSVEDTSVNSNTSSSVMTLISGTYTTTNANDILIYGVETGTSVSAQTAGAGFTIPANATQNRIAMQEEIVSATQSAQTTVMTWTTNATAASVFAAFKASGAAPPASGPNKRIKLEQIDAYTVIEGGGVWALLNQLNLFFGPCDPADMTCTESLRVCFADGVCHSVFVGDKPVLVSIVKNWSPKGVPKTDTLSIASFTALPNAAVP